MTRDPPPGIGLSDPDNWIGHWTSLHPSALFAGELARLALALLDDPGFEDGGVGQEEIRFTENDQDHVIEVKYLLRQFPTGKVVTILSIRSPEDPLPPLIDRP